MKILLAKRNCEKCQYVKENFDLSDVIVYNMDETWGGLLGKKELDEVVEVLTEVAFSNAILLTYKAMPILVIDGKIAGIGKEVLEGDRSIPTLKICREYLSYRRNSEERCCQ